MNERLSHIDTIIRQQQLNEQQRGIDCLNNQLNDYIKNIARERKEIMDHGSEFALQAINFREANLLMAVSKMREVLDTCEREFILDLTNFKHLNIVRDEELPPSQEYLAYEYGVEQSRDDLLTMLEPYENAEQRDKVTSLIPWRKDLALKFYPAVVLDGAVAVYQETCIPGVEVELLYEGDRLTRSLYNFPEKIM